MKRFFITGSVLAKDEAATGALVKDIRIVHPSERIRIADPAKDPFVPIAKYYQEGWFDRPDVFVCAIPHARVHIGTGLVCTPDYRSVADFGMEHRLSNYPEINTLRPIFVKPVPGVCTTINYCLAGNFWHWLIDCLPKLHALERVVGDEKVTVLMPESAKEFQRETLQAALPPRFEVKFFKRNPWLDVDRLLWCSLVSGLCVGCLPREYYAAVRRPIFQRYGLTDAHPKTERIYVSRQGAGHRRVKNEEALMSLIRPYGFRRVSLETMSFREQVELFHRAEIVVGPHGAGMGTIYFSGDIDLVVLYPNQTPSNYFHSLAQGLGQRHYFVCHEEADEDADFEADLPAIEEVLRTKLGLKAKQA